MSARLHLAQHFYSSRYPVFILQLMNTWSVATWWRWDCWLLRQRTRDVVATAASVVMLKQDVVDHDRVTRMSTPMTTYSHCDNYYVNSTKFTHWTVYDGLTDTLIVNVLVFVVSSTLFSKTQLRSTHTHTEYRLRCFFYWTNSRLGPIPDPGDTPKWSRFYQCWSLNVFFWDRVICSDAGDDPRHFETRLVWDTAKMFVA